ncbi:MAG: M23 family metallopeptidase, partial [Clostridiales bacterium]|nr:M23 family metallopeptidase [Clostridiales bacterium]
EDYVPTDGDASPTLVSPADGAVQRNSTDTSYGNYVVIKTTDNKVILMAHLKAKSSLAVGASVKAGDTVGVMGATGNVTGAHLHIEVQNSATWAYNKNLLKPSDYIDFTNYSTSSTASGVSSLSGVGYQNGSTIEKTYMTTADAKAGKNSIGNLEKKEACKCYVKADSYYGVVYDTSSSGKKTGFVTYAGGASSAPTSGLAYANGSTKEPTYSTIADAKAGKNSIGYLDPYETCTCYGKMDGYYLVVYTTSSGTKKMGFVEYAGGVK